MRLIILAIFLMSGNCFGQQSIKAESRWEYDFEITNRIPDTVAIYDCETTFPVPGYEIVTRIIGYNCEVIKTSNGFYLLITNKYESIFKNLYNQKYLQKQHFSNIK